MGDAPRVLQALRERGCRSEQEFETALREVRGGSPAERPGGCAGRSWGPPSAQGLPHTREDLKGRGGGLGKASGPGRTGSAPRRPMRTAGAGLALAAPCAYPL